MSAACWDSAATIVREPGDTGPIRLREHTANCQDKIFSAFGFHMLREDAAGGKQILEGELTVKLKIKGVNKLI